MQGIAKVKSLCALALIGLMALVAASPAAAGLAGEEQALLPNTGNIRGTITDGSGEPVEELEVCAQTEGTEPSFTYCARTEQGGQYLIVDVPEQGYKVWAQSLTYLGGWPQGYPQIFYPGVDHFEEATWVPVHGEATTTGVDFQVHEGGGITGTVTAEDTGGPIAGIQVCPTWATGHERAEVHSCGITDAAGDYLIQNVDTGEYTVEFDTHWNPEFEHYQYPEALEFETAWYSGAATLAEADPVSVTAGQTTTGIDAELTRAGSGGETPSSTDSSASGAKDGVQGQSGYQTQVPVPTVTFKRADPTRLACTRGFRKAKQNRVSRCVKIHKKVAHPVARASHKTHR
jgi:Carboxypeptidase regulatory-like domain